MTKPAFVLVALALMTSSQVAADTHYMLCSGGGQAGVYYSDVFAVPGGTKTQGVATMFNAFVKAKYGATIHAECHSNGTRASAVSDKKMRESSNQDSKFPSKLIETGWAGK